jgi:hypothetical protein
MLGRQAGYCLFSCLAPRHLTRFFLLFLGTTPKRDADLKVDGVLDSSRCGFGACPRSQSEGKPCAVFLVEVHLSMTTRWAVAFRPCRKKRISISSYAATLLSIITFDFDASPGHPCAIGQSTLFDYFDRRSCLQDSDRGYPAKSFGRFLRLSCLFFMDLHKSLLVVLFEAFFEAFRAASGSPLLHDQVGR